LAGKFVEGSLPPLRGVPGGWEGNIGLTLRVNTSRRRLLKKPG
jgi:hypothetical protein